MRRKTTATERQKYVEDCLASGKPKRTWCREKGIPYTTFANWTKVIPKAASLKTECPVQWVDVTPPHEAPVLLSPQTPAQGPPQPRIRLKGGGFEITVELGFNPEFLEDILRVVSRLCC